MTPRSWLAGTCFALLSLLAPCAWSSDGWRSVQTTHYTVLSRLDDRDTRAWVAEFDLFIASLTSLLGIQGSTLTPLTVVLFDKDEDLAPYRQVALHGTAAAGGCCAHVAGGRVIGIAAGAPSEAMRRATFHEGVHWVTGADPAPRPRWLDEGIAELFSTFGVRGASVHWGDTIADHAVLLQDRGLMPLRQLFESNAAGGQYTAQSWALAHLLLLGDKSGERTQLQSYLQAYRHQAGGGADGPAFAGDYERLQDSLRAYVAQPQLTRGVRQRELVERRYVVGDASTVAVATALERLSLDCALQANATR